MDISLDLYKTFIIVAKNKSMTKASEEMMISQPAISKSIKTLEGQLGVSLFNRSNKGLELTEEGKMIYNKVNMAMNLITNVETNLESYKKLEEGEVRIGISSVLSKCLLIETIKHFRSNYPKVKITIINGIAENLIEQLNLGKLDFVIYNDNETSKYNANIEKLTSFYYVFFYNRNHYIVNKIESLEDFNEYSLILQQKGSNTRDILDYKTENKLVPSIEVMSQDLLIKLVEEGLGIGFAFEELVDKNPNFEKIYLPNIDAVDIKIATNKNVKPSFAATTFLKELKFRI